MHDIVSVFDIIIALFFVFAIFLWAHKYQDARIEKYNYYSHFTRALFLRIFSGLIFACVYIFYYDGGDTQYYFTGTRSIVRMATKDFGAFIQLMLGERTPELRSLFDHTTGWPTYFKDANSWAVCRFTVPIYILGCGTYVGTTIIMNLLLFFPLWRFYKMLVRFYPKNASGIALALFYIPSVCFWGSGLLKDIWCMVGVLAIYTSSWMIFIRKKNIRKNFLTYLFWAYILTSIRPYAFYTVFATSLVWIGLDALERFDSKVFRVAFFPILAIFLVAIFAIFLDNMSDIAEGKYASVNSMMEQAVVIQDDLKRDYYGSNSFDIGTFDASLSGMLGKLPQAITAGLYRPFIWEARTPFMLLSGLENFVLLILTLYTLLTMRSRFFKLFYNDNFLFSIAIFTIAFGFFIGLTIANFGALVRYRIILMPFFAIILCRLLYQKKKYDEDEYIE